MASPDQLRADGQALRLLADQVERVLDPAWTQLRRMADAGAFAGALADRTGADLQSARARLGLMAERLREHADGNVRLADRLDEQAG